MICKITNKKIDKIFSFGKMPVANGFLKKEEISNEFFFDLSFGFSEEISLFQINDHPPIEKMFNKNYPFFTSKSKFMVEHFEKFAKNLNKKGLLNENTNVLEIGSNDGTFLSKISKYTNKTMGIEPSENVHKAAEEKGINSRNCFFTYYNARKILDTSGKFDLVVAANVICHIPDLKDLFKGITEILSDNGSFIFEEPYLMDMYKKTTYDQIYDEHIYIFSLSSIEKIANEFGLRLYHAEPQSTHGGSMRYFLSRKKGKTKDLEDLIEKEKFFEVDKKNTAIKFKDNCEISKKILKSKINSILDNGQKICGYGATSKSTTILNFCGINFNHIDFIVDNTPEKQGLVTPGSHIPIFEISKFHQSAIKYVFLFAWNHREEIIQKETGFINKGGKFFDHIF